MLGLSYNISTGENYMDLVDPATGATTLLSSFSFDTGGWVSGTFVATAADAYAISGGGRLYDFNAATGGIKSTYSIGAFKGLAASGDSLIGLGYNASTQHNFLESIDPATGVTALLSSFTFDSGGWLGGTFVATPVDAYVLSGGGTLYDFDAATGALKSTSKIGEFQGLVVSGSDLLGIGYNLSTGQNYLDSINPATGATTLLNAFNFDTGGWVSGSFVATAGDVYALSSGGTLYDFNAATGALRSTVTIGGFQALAIPTASGLDTSSIKAINAIAAKIAQRYDFVAAYLNSHAGGALTAKIASDLTHDGLRLVSIFETAAMASSSYFSANPESKGKLIGETAYKDALKDGQGADPGSAIYFGIDFDPGHNAALLADIGAFFEGVAQGFQAAVGAGPVELSIGVYGAGITDSTIVGDKLASYSWLAGSPKWTGTNNYTGWNIYQNQTISQFGVSIDPDQAAGSSFGQWTSSPTPSLQQDAATDVRPARFAQIAATLGAPGAGLPGSMTIEPARASQATLLLQPHGHA